MSNWAYLSPEGPLVVTIKECIDGLRLHIGPDSRPHIWQLDIWDDETIRELRDTCARIMQDREADCAES